MSEEQEDKKEPPHKRSKVSHDVDEEPGRRATTEALHGDSGGEDKIMGDDAKNKDNDDLLDSEYETNDDDDDNDENRGQHCRLTKINLQLVPEDLHC